MPFIQFYLSCYSSRLRLLNIFYFILIVSECDWGFFCSRYEAITVILVAFFTYFKEQV